MTARRQPPGWQQVGAVLAVCLVTCFAHLGAPRASLMEARNLVAAREMVAGGSWLIPTMNGALRVAKPPLPTWAVAGLQRLLGPTDDLGLLRLPAAGMALLMVFFLWGLARELTRDAPGETDAPGRTAWLAALVLGSSLLLVMVGRDGQWDIFAQSFLLGSLWALARGWRTAGQGWLGLSGLLLGASILSKGPVALYGMLLPFLLVFFLPRLNPGRAPARGRWGGVALLAGLGLAVGLAWPLYLSLQHEVAPAALAVARVEITSWSERQAKPFWAYWTLPLFTGIWLPVALAALAVPYARRRAGRYVPYALVLGWLLAGLVLLSVIPQKKERYMLPLMPPLALLIAGLLRYAETAFRQARATRTDRRLLRIWGTLLALVCLLVPVAMAVVQLPGFGPGSWRFGVAVPGFGLLAGLAGWAAWRGGRPLAVAGASVGLLGLLIVLLMPAYPVWEQRKTEPGLRQMEDLRASPLLTPLPWYTLDELLIQQIWAAGRAAPLLPRTTDLGLRPPTRPVVVLSVAPLAGQLPAAWRGRVLVQPVDSFYPSRKRKDGYWRVSVVRPSASPPSPLSSTERGN